MSDGLRTPVAHDGQAAFAEGRGRVRLLRNPGVTCVITGPWR